MLMTLERLGIAVPNDTGLDESFSAFMEDTRSTRVALCMERQRIVFMNTTTIDKDPANIPYRRGLRSRYARACPCSHLAYSTSLESTPQRRSVNA